MSPIGQIARSDGIFYNSVVFWVRIGVRPGFYSVLEIAPSELPVPDRRNENAAKQYGMTGTSSNAALSKSELFAQLVAENQRALYLHILTMVPHTADAEEILQETNLVIWQHAADFEMETNFRAWSLAIAYHRVLKYREKSRRDGLTFNSELIDVLASETSETNDALESQLAALSHCTEQLRPADRELLVEYYRNGSGGLAAAKRFQRPVGSIYKSVCRIRKALMRCMTLHRLREEHA